MSGQGGDDAKRQQRGLSPVKCRGQLRGPREQLPEATGAAGGAAARPGASSVPGHGGGDGGAFHELLGPSWAWDREARGASIHPSLSDPRVGRAAGHQAGFLAIEEMSLCVAQPARHRPWGRGCQTHCC